MAGLKVDNEIALGVKLPETIFAEIELIKTRLSLRVKTGLIFI